MMNVDPADLLNDNPSADNGIKCDGSTVYQNETLQLYINGQTLFDANGIDSDARRLSILSDAWGSLNLPVFSSMFIADNNKSQLQNILSKGCMNAVGKLGFWGCVTQSKFTEFVAEHSRVVTGAVGSFNMYFWGEVVKKLVIQNGKYVLSYA